MHLDLLLGTPHCGATTQATPARRLILANIENKNNSYIGSRESRESMIKDSRRLPQFANR